MATQEAANQEAAHDHEIQLEVEVHAVPELPTEPEHETSVKFQWVVQSLMMNIKLVQKKIYSNYQLQASIDERPKESQRMDILMSSPFQTQQLSERLPQKRGKPGGES
jgi:hypothetical protein